MLNSQKGSLKSVYDSFLQRELGYIFHNFIMVKLKVINNDSEIMLNYVYFHNVRK